MSVNMEMVKHPVVRAAITALQAGDRERWFAQFTPDASLYDDGHAVDLIPFFNKALGHERFTHIDRVEADGTALYGRFHSDQWGDFKTYFRFHLNESGKIERLEIGQAEYWRQ
jgi:hypothetical protein